MKKRKATSLHNPPSTLARFMSGLYPDQKRLNEIQTVYDNLTLLGQLLCAGTDISRMRSDFNNLASVLLDQLAMEYYKKASLHLDSCARVAIDILTRNLFERTADIGFLATDSEIRKYAEAVEENPETTNSLHWKKVLGSHFMEYVQKYSVYHNIILLSPQGEVLAQLDTNNFVERTTDSLVREALNTDHAYVEISRPTDLLPGLDNPLVYAYRVMSSDDSHPVGVLCLCFRLQDECRRIFENLVAEDDWTIITLLDSEQRVIASSDHYQFPIGARIGVSGEDGCQIIRFSGREYLSATRIAHGYQGYTGPGWVGHALAPLNHAFEMSEAHELENIPADLINRVVETATLFSPELRDIPLRAATIQQELNRAVWNGNLWLISDQSANNAAFAKVLLREIGSTGIRTRSVFSESTTNLYKTVLSSVLFDCRSQAALAIDILNRNLYERANDCRWWALTRLFCDELAHPNLTDPSRTLRLTDVLRTINDLYTVYSNLILFDHLGRVIALSNPAYGDWVGKSLPDTWVRPTLALRNTQSYTVTSFSTTDLYAGQPTYVYSAAIRNPNKSEPVGGISIVFDATPQFQAMLHDALPRQENGSLVPGAFAVFAGREGHIISSTDGSLQPGSRLSIDPDFFNLQRGESRTGIMIRNGRYYAVGSCMENGYREYKSTEDPGQTDVVALVFSPLSEHVSEDSEGIPPLQESMKNPPAIHSGIGENTVDIACFFVGHNWYGIPSKHVIEVIDIHGLTPIPGAPDFVKGCMMYREQAMTVFDLSTAVSTKNPERERRHRNSVMTRIQILVLRSPGNRNPFGILVDSLGDIAEIPVTQIEPVPAMMANGHSLVENLVKPGKGSPERRILIVLSVDRILRRFAVEYAAA